ncbi:hypothetical protein [Mesobacillus subterraneus]|uniref:Uncharacterized protein n=1 Tax=Mesobacillus subterraneus TaxID=285983 RepID=A0A3R9FKW1_9BACI|nr:hypothetical protein [Mesobacillus subterraneus]RSD28781.1 hypothetical protein EJA10_04215 [Mesobacillus subterraneus]
MPRKSAAAPEGTEDTEVEKKESPDKENEVERLNRLLAAVLEYLSDDEVEVIDIEYLLENTEGLREWWDQYRERNRKKIEEEITNALGELSIEELESLREKIKGK